MRAGEPTKETFTENPQGFEIVVTDPTRPDIRDQSVASVTLSANRFGTGEIDRIDNIEMTNIVKNGRASDHYDLGKRQIVVVTDRVDDGEQPAVSVDGTRTLRFSPDDGDSKDPTIRAGVRDSLKLTYANKAKGITVENSFPIHVCRRVRRVRLRLINLVGSGWDEARIDSAVALATEIWAQACIEVEVVSRTAISTPTPSQLTPRQESVKRYENAQGNFLYNHSSLSADLKAIIGLRDLPAREQSRFDGEITVYFIEQFVDQNGARNDTVTGLAVREGAYKKTLEEDSNNNVGEDDDLMGTIFIVGAGLGSSAQVATGKTLAHEVAHIVISSDHVDEWGRVNILATGARVTPNGLQKKRFNGEQVRILREDLNNYLR